MADYLEYLRYIGALVFVIALILGLSYILRRAGGGGLASVRTGKHERRLRIVEVLPVDGKHRLVLVAHDNREHLLLLGHERDLVVEAGVMAGSSPSEQPVAVAPDVQEQTRQAARYMPASRTSLD
jgi:flagellar protein FliO/FliZ